jgi:hypothetical protein
MNTGEQLMKKITLQQFGVIHTKMRGYETTKIKNYSLYKRRYGGQWDILKGNKTISKEHECVGTFSTIRECKAYLKQFKENN